MKRKSKREKERLRWSKRQARRERHRHERELLDSANAEPEWLLYATTYINAARYAMDAKWTSPAS